MEQFSDCDDMHAHTMSPLENDRNNYINAYCTTESIKVPNYSHFSQGHTLFTHFSAQSVAASLLFGPMFGPALSGLFGAGLLPSLGARIKRVGDFFFFSLYGALSVKPFFAYRCFLVKEGFPSCSCASYTFLRVEGTVELP